MRKLVKRNRELYDYYIKESERIGATYGDVGKKFGVTAARAWRIVKTEREKRAQRLETAKVGGN